MPAPRSIQYTVFFRHSSQNSSRHRPIIFTTLLLSGKLYEHLTEINRACTERIHPKGIVIIGNTSQLNNRDNKFDIVIEYFVRNGNYDLNEINEVLYDLDPELPLIGC